MPLRHCGRCCGQAGHHHGLHWAHWCEIPVAAFEQACSMGQAFLEGTAFDLAFQEKTVASICRFSLANRKGTFKLNGQQYKAYTHRILPGFVHPDGFQWGTSELRVAGHSASEAGKVFSPIPHHQSLWAL